MADKEKDVEQQAQAQAQAPEAVDVEAGEVSAEEDAPLSQAASEILAEMAPVRSAIEQLAQDAIEARKKPRLLTRRDFEPAEVPLPSGALVAIRPIDLESLARTGVIPQHLRHMALEVAQRKDPTLLTEAEVEGLTDEQIEEKRQEAERQYVETIDTLVCHVVASPRLVMTEEDEDKYDDAVWVTRLQFTDKLYIVNYVEAPAVAFKSFRRE